MAHFLRSGRRIRENFLENEVIAHDKRDRRTGRKKDKENTAGINNFGNDVLLHFNYGRNSTAKFTTEILLAPNPTPKNKSINMLNLDPVSKSSKITHAKKGKRKNIGKKKYSKVGNKICDDKKTQYFVSNKDTDIHYQQDRGNIIEAKNLSNSRELFLHQIEQLPALNCQTENNFLATDTYSWNDKNVNWVSNKEDYSNIDNCPKSSCSPNANLTFDLSSGKSSPRLANIMNTTYEKLRNIDSQSTEEGCLNKTFDKSEDKIISTGLNTKKNVSQVEEQCEAFPAHVAHLRSDKSDDLDHTVLDSTLKVGSTLIRQHTFTKDRKVYPRQIETTPCISTTDVTLGFNLNSDPPAGRNITSTSCHMTPSATSVTSAGVLSKEFRSKRKCNRTEGAVLHTPVLRTPQIPYTTTTPTADSERGTRAPPRTQLPNFAALHRRQFARMESLDECQRRRAQRAQRLLQARPAHTPGDGQRKREIAVPPAGAYNRFGFREQGGARSVAGAAGSGAVAQEARARTRSLLRGVRTNRRFDLLMKARRGVQ